MPTNLKKENMKNDTFELLEKKRLELVDKGFTGFSIFVDRNKDITDRQRAQDMLNLLNALDNAK